MKTWNMWGKQFTELQRCHMYLYSSTSGLEISWLRWMFQTASATCWMVCECLHLTTCFRLSREEKPTRCLWMVYCTYNMLNMFWALLCPSSGACDYMCVQEEGCCTSCSIPLSGCIACCPAPDPRQPATKHCKP